MSADNFCLEGAKADTAAQQPRCINGVLSMDVKCKSQPVVDCTSPANGGCDPMTKCDDSTNIFGTLLVRCEACPPGEPALKTSLVDGCRRLLPLTAVATALPAGYFGSGRSQCTECPRGTFWDKSMVGQFAPKTKACKSCPEGSSTRGLMSVNMSSCICQPGYSGVISSSLDQCVPCPVGQYGEAGSPGLCTTCPIHSTTSAVGARTANKCVCLEGYFRDETTDACTACPTGTYKSLLGPDPCIACNDGHITDTMASTDVAECHAPKTTCVEKKDMLGYNCESYVVGGRACKTMLALGYDCQCTCDDSKLPIGCTTAVADLSTACSDSADLLKSDICDSKSVHSKLHSSTAPGAQRTVLNNPALTIGVPRTSSDTRTSAR